MSRHTQAVDTMDRRRQLLVRGVSFIAAALLLIFALWTADVPVGRVVEWVQSWFVSSPDQKVARTPAPETTPTSTAKARVAPVDVPTGTDSSVSPTPLPLYLVATSPGRNLREGSARLGANPEFPQTFVAGATLANGAKLAEIYKDHVVLERNKERIELFVGTDKTKVLARRAKGALNVAMVGGPKPAEPVHTAEHSRDLSEVIRSMARYENNQLVGLQVFPGQKSFVYSQLGLQPGDVVVAIDGSPVVDAKAATNQLQGLTHGAAMSVTVMRDGQSSALSLDGAVVAKTFEKASSSPPNSLPMPPTG